MSLQEALLNVQSQITKVHKDGKNPHTKSGYPTLEAVLDVINDPLQEQGLVVKQATAFTDGQWVLRTTVCLNKEKECDSFDLPLLGLEGSKNPMQALGSALTYARRYALMSYFKLAATDDDGEDAGNETLSFSKEKKSYKKPENKIQDLKIADGKFKGMWVSEVPPDELSAYITMIDSAVAETGREHPKWFLDLKKAAGA